MHDLTGGVMAELQGGKFGHGFAAAGFTAAATSFNNSNHIGGKGFSFTRVAIGAVIGGTASKLSGGKFANGAVTGAFSQALNNEFSELRRASVLKSEIEYWKKAFGDAWDGAAERLKSVDSWIDNNVDVSVDGELCAGACIGAEAELTQSHGVSTTIQSGFGLKGGGGAGSDISILSVGVQPSNNTISTYNYVSGALGPVGVTIDHSAWGDGSYMNMELNLRFPGSLGVNGGTGIKKW